MEDSTQPCRAAFWTPVMGSLSSPAPENQPQREDGSKVCFIPAFHFSGDVVQEDPLLQNSSESSARQS